MIAKIEAARAAGHRITANMYTYQAGATGLDAAMPPWVQEGGLEKWIARLKDPEVRARVIAEMRDPNTAWDNLYALAGPEGTLMLSFKNPKLKPLTGKRLSEIAAMRHESPEDTAIDLVIEDGSRVGVAYFLMSEDNIKRELALPYVSFGSDESAQAPEGVFLKSHPHPRAYGNFARVLGHYVRDEKVIPLPEAIRKLSALPASNLSLHDRGMLKVGRLRRCGGVRSRHDPGPRHLRSAAGVCHRRERSVRQRHGGAEERRAHRRAFRPLRARPRLDGLAGRRLPQIRGRLAMGEKLTRQQLGTFVLVWLIRSPLRT